MIDIILAWALRNRFLVAIATLLVIAGGVIAVRTLPIDAVPDLTNVQVQILTRSPALGPEQVEQLITTPIERALGGLPKLEQLRSTSKVGLSVVTVVFDEGTDIYFARQLVAERLQQARAAIPDGVGEPELGPISTGLGEVYQFELRGRHSPMELRSILEFEVSPRLRAVRGVVEVNAFGGELKTYEVQVAPDRLAAFGLSIGDVMAALERNNADAGGASIERGGEQYLIRGEGRIETLDDVRDVVVRTDGAGTPIFVRQLGEVAFAPMVRQGAVTRDGRGEIVSATVMMLMGASSRQVVGDVKQAIAELTPMLAKQGVEIVPFYDRTELVDHTIRTVTRSLVEGGVLVMLILFVMLRDLRAGLVVAIVIPLSMLVAFIGMRRFGVSGNLMSLGAIDFGLIVDGAVIVVENAVSRIAERSTQLGRALDPRERTDAVMRASHEVMRSAVFGVAIIAIVYLPILSLQGVEGKMFRPMAMTVLFALAGALALALTLVPALASLLLPRRMTERPSFVVAAAHRVYAPLLRWALRRRGLVLAAAGLVLAGAGLAYRTLGAELVPKLDEGSMILSDLRLPSVSLAEAVRRNAQVEAVLGSFPEVVAVVSKTGRPEIATDPMSVNQSDVFVMLKPRAAWTTATTREGLIAAFDAALRRRIIGEAFSWSQPIEMRMSELIAGVRADVALNIYGDDLETLAATATRAAAIIASVPGAADVKAAQGEGLPVLTVDIDRRAIARHGIDAADVLEIVAAIGGREVGTVIEGRRRFSLQVRFAADARKDKATIEALRVRAPGGQLIPIGQLADVRLDVGPAEVQHERGRRFITVQANVRTRDLAGFVAEARAKLERADLLPPGYFAAWGGQYENLKAATARLALVVPVALASIFVLLYLATRRMRLAALIYLNVPFAVTGGVFALALRGMPFSITAGIGFIALFGVGVLNGLVLVGDIQHRREAGASSEVAALEGATVRLRPVLTTALVASLGFVPMAIASGAGAEVQKPLATVVIGGLLTATALTLLVLPTLYAWLMRGASRE